MVAVANSRSFRPMPLEESIVSPLPTFRAARPFLQLPHALEKGGYNRAHTNLLEPPLEVTGGLVPKKP